MYTAVVTATIRPTAARARVLLVVFVAILLASFPSRGTRTKPKKIQTFQDLEVYSQVAGSSEGPSSAFESDCTPVRAMGSKEFDGDRSHICGSRNN